MAPDPAQRGLAINHLMTNPAFANCSFGHWCRTPVGQISRGHSRLILRGARMPGFPGWVIANEEKAKGWTTGRRALHENGLEVAS